MHHTGRLPSPGIDWHVCFEVVFTRLQYLDAKMPFCTQSPSLGPMANQTQPCRHTLSSCRSRQATT